MSPRSHSWCLYKDFSPNFPNAQIESLVQVLYVGGKDTRFPRFCLWSVTPPTPCQSHLATISQSCLYHCDIFLAYFPARLSPLIHPAHYWRSHFWSHAISAVAQILARLLHLNTYKSKLLCLSLNTHHWLRLFLLPFFSNTFLKSGWPTVLNVW